jgi:hypothetical protein
MGFNQAITKSMQFFFKYTKMFKVNKIHDIMNFMNFCPMACSIITRHSLQLVMILNLDVDFMTLTKNHKAPILIIFIYFGSHFG